uniref:CwfJ_C_1 domain-containing protein n=1 Tax=Syphacia muris TaxID=451379 RepID=A0A0N5AXC5_9BILA
MSKDVKVLVSGDVNGHFDKFVKRISIVNKKNGPFDMVFCVGEFFGPDDQINQKVLNGEIEFPITTYILGPCCPSTSKYYVDDCAEFSSNLTYLGKKGVLNSATGLQIAYLSGIEGTKANAFQFDANIVDECMIPVKAQSGFLGVDILLTSMWPADVAKHSPNQPTRPTDGSRLISKLAAGLKPRYHFAGLGSHYERTPYRNHRILLEAAQHTTRFIGLAPVNNEEKMKWLYAFSCVPMRSMTRTALVQQPPNASEFPYMTLLADMILEDRSKKISDKAKSEKQYFFDMSKSEDDEIQDRSGTKRKYSEVEGAPDRRQPRVQQPCWFCLSNADFEKYLVITVGEHCYAAMPKGPLTDDHSNDLDHVQSIVASSNEIRVELEKFKTAFTQMYDKQKKVPVVFERNFKSQHLQLQIVPVPIGVSKHLKTSFINAAQLRNIELIFLDPDQKIWDVVAEGSPYFYLELPDGTRFVSLKMRNFPIQFGREVLSGPAILNCEEKIDWRSCELEKSVQADLVKKLQQDFKPFDFTDDDDSD